MKSTTPFSVRYNIRKIGTATRHVGLAIGLCLYMVCAASIQRKEDTRSLKGINNNSPTEISNCYTDTMIYVNGGTFIMGSNEENSSKPIHQVTLSSFYIGKYEVTQAQWNAVMSYNPSFYTSCPQCPVERVSRREIDAFLKILNSRTGERYRLPTEAEWEFAARGGNESKGYIYAGSNDPESVAWYSNNSGKSTHPVGQKQPNELGLYDMSGNVTEWCSDWYGPYKDEAQTNPQGAVYGLYFALRGGNCISNPIYLRCTKRSMHDQALRRNEGGFRLVKSAL